MNKSSGKIKFKKNDTIGALDAEHDSRFLDECFVDTGDLDTLMDISAPARILLGRPGSGKTALIQALEKRAISEGKYVINLNPADLSFNHICNSSLLRQMIDAKINVDPFFKLLWKHVFAVSIFQKRFDYDDIAKEGFFANLRSLFESKKNKAEVQSKRKALDYVERWGGQFWASPDVRIKEIVARFENEAKVKTTGHSSSKARVPVVSMSADLKIEDNGREFHSLQMTLDEIERVKNVVNEIQVKELSGILDLVAEVLDNKNKPCFILIDRLDEDWVDDDLRESLMKALLETTREFRDKQNTKIVVSLRIDMLEKLFAAMQNDAGFQEEKIRTLYLPLVWTSDQLTEIVNSRIRLLFRDAYTLKTLDVNDLFKAKGNRNRSVDLFRYMLDRTWNRPRDIIDFFNSCITHSDEKVPFDLSTVQSAEVEYSSSRLRAIGTEWEHIFPGIISLLRHCLRNRPGVFNASAISDDTLVEWAINVNYSNIATGPVALCLELINNERYREARKSIISLLYRVGAIGVKTTSGLPARWADNRVTAMPSFEEDSFCEIQIHKALWRELGVGEN